MSLFRYLATDIQEETKESNIPQTITKATMIMDNETERAVNEMLLGLMKECRGLTVLTIAHRESSLAYCHRVIRLNGKDNGSNL